MELVVAARSRYPKAVTVRHQNDTDARSRTDRLRQQSPGAQRLVVAVRREDQDRRISSRRRMAGKREVLERPVLSVKLKKVRRAGPRDPKERAGHDPKN